MFGRREGAELFPRCGPGRKIQTGGQTWIQTWDWAVSKAIHWTWITGLKLHPQGEGKKETDATRIRTCHLKLNANCRLLGREKRKCIRGLK